MDAGLVVAIAESILFSNKNQGDVKKVHAFLTKTLGPYIGENKISLVREKKGKKKRAEGEPKRPLPSFFLFTKEARESVIAENPTASFKEIGRILGEKWKSMSEEEKKKYEDIAKENMKRYANEMAAFKASSSSSKKK